MALSMPRERFFALRDLLPSASSSKQCRQDGANEARSSRGDRRRERPDIEGLAPLHNVPMHTASAQAQHLTEGIEQLLEGAEQMLKREAERPRLLSSCTRAAGSEPVRSSATHEGLKRQA
jgi:hypothetical protein